jgi:hypothetical protein
MIGVRLGIDDVHMSNGAGPKRHLGRRRARPFSSRKARNLDEALGTERGRTSRRCLRERRRPWQRYPGYNPVIASSGVSRQLYGTSGRIRVRPPLFAIMSPIPIGDILCARMPSTQKRSSIVRHRLQNGPLRNDSLCCPEKRFPEQQRSDRRWYAGPRFDVDEAQESSLRLRQKTVPSEAPLPAQDRQCALTSVLDVVWGGVDALSSAR